MTTKFFQIPANWQDTQLVIFEPRPLAEGLKASTPVSEGHQITLALTNLSAHPFTLATGTSLRHAQAVATAQEGPHLLLRYCQKFQATSVKPRGILSLPP